MEAEARRARLADLVFAVAVMAVSAFFFVEARRLPPSRFDPLGPGTFPLAISGLLVLLGALALILTLLGRNIGRAEISLIVGVSDADASHRPRPWLAVFAFLAVAAYALVLQFTPVDFFWATAGLIAVLGIAMSDRSPRMIAIAVAVGLGASGAITVLFGQLLRLLLP